MQRPIIATLVFLLLPTLAYAAFFPTGKGALPGFVAVPAVTPSGGNATATLISQCSWNGCTDENRLANASNAGTLTITTPPATSMFNGEYLYVAVKDIGTAPSSIAWAAGSGVSLNSAVPLDSDNAPGSKQACGSPPATGYAVYKWHWDSTVGILRLLACSTDPSSTGILPGNVASPAVTASGGNATATLIAQCAWSGCTDENRLANSTNAGILTITTPLAASMFDGEYLYVTVTDSGTAPSSITWTGNTGVTLNSAVLGDTDGAPGSAAACNTPPATGKLIYKWHWNSSTGVLRLIDCRADPSPSTLSKTLGGTGQTTAQSARGSNGLDVESLTVPGDINYTILPADREVDTSGPWNTPVTWTLPAANAVNPGQTLQISDPVNGTGGSALTVQAAGSDTIAFGLTSVVIHGAGETLLLESDGVSKWRVLNGQFTPVFYIRNPVAGAEVSGFQLTYDVYFPANLTQPTSRISCATNPSASSVYTLMCGSTTLGTFSVPTNCTNNGAGTVATTGGTTQTCGANNRLRIVAPPSLPATPETGIAFTVAGLQL